MSLVLKERRAVIRSGPKSLQMTLPATWCKWRRIKSGDKLDVIITEKALFVTTDPKDAKAFLKALGYTEIEENIEKEAL